MASNNENNPYSSGRGGGIRFPYGIPGRQPMNPVAAAGVARPVQRSGGRIPVPAVPQKDICEVCDRKVAKIVCGACGFECKRVRAVKECQKHPNRKFLQDLAECPRCRTPNLYEEDGSSQMDVE